MRFLLVGLLLFASTALGQTLTLTVGSSTDPSDTLGLNREDCGRNLDLKWSFTGGTACEPLQLWVTTASSCGEAPAAGDYVLDEVPEGNVGNPGTEVRRIAVDQLPVFTSADGGSTTCSTATVDQTMRVCGFTQSASLTNICDIDVKVSTAPKIRFDTRPPPKPTISAVIPRDSALGVTVSAESDSTVRVVALLTDGDGGVGAEVASDETTATGTAELADLQNGVTYQVLAYATDQSKNTSEASDPSTGTPVASRGFFGTYVDAGGAERGGCGVAGGSLAGGAALAILGIWLSRRKQS